MMRIFIQLLLLSTFFACSSEKMEPLPPVIPEVKNEMSISILSLGDSYTKGTSVVASQKFPVQLKDQLDADTFSIEDGSPWVIANTGWRTDDLKTAIQNAAFLQDTFSLVTLCIGVNNQYLNGDVNVYKADFENLLKTAIQKAGNRQHRVMVVSIPDWAFTPYGQNFPEDPVNISAEIDSFNQANKFIADQYGVHYIDVTGISRQGLVRPELVAYDGLHPSELQYTEWVQLMLPVAMEALSH